LVINSVSLLENGKEIATDPHTGFAARNPSKQVYVLDVPAVNANAKYILRATVSGTNSSGTISWAVEPPGKRQ
jgi:hypothetical protein